MAAGSRNYVIYAPAVHQKSRIRLVCHPHFANAFGHCN